MLEGSSFPLTLLGVFFGINTDVKVLQAIGHSELAVKMFFIVIMVIIIVQSNTYLLKCQYG